VKIDVERLFRKIGNQEVYYYVFFKQGCISEPLFLMLPSDAQHLYDEMQKYFNPIKKDKKD